MRYILVFLKVILLVVLIIGSIFQTGKLWFEDISDRNFFYDTISDSNNIIIDGVGLGNDFIVPEQVGVYVGAPDIEYTVIGYGATFYSGIVEASKSVFKKVLESGTYVDDLEDDSDLWTSQHIMLILPFELTGNDLAKGFGLTPSDVKMIDGAEAIIITPAGTDGKSLHLYIENSITDALHHFQINKKEVLIQDEALTSYLSSIVEGENNPAYISTRKNNPTRKNSLPFYDRSMLLPMVSRDIRYHSSLYWEVPFVDKDVIDEEAVRQFVRGYFDNPDVLSKISYDEEVRFTAGNTIVRYTNEGILDYTMNSDATGVPDLSDAITLAEQFLKENVKNTSFEYHLSSYEVGEEDMTIYYNFGFNGFPIVMDIESRDYYRQPTSVALKVRGDEVTHFHGIMRQIPDLLPQFETFSTPYNEALDQMITESGGLDEPISAMYLGYKWNEAASEMKLHWIIELNDQLHFIEVGGD